MLDDRHVRPGNSTRRAQTLLGLLVHAASIVGLIAFAAVMVVTLLQVFARYLEIALPWTEELARVLFLAAMMLSIAVAIQQREHIVVDFFFAKRSSRTQAALTIAFDTAILLLLAIWLDGARRLLTLNMGSSFITLPWLPVPVLYAVEACAIAIMMLLVFADLLVQIRRYKTGGGTP